MSIIGLNIIFTADQVVDTHKNPNNNDLFWSIIYGSTNITLIETGVLPNTYGPATFPTIFLTNAQIAANNIEFQINLQAYHISTGDLLSAPEAPTD